MQILFFVVLSFFIATRVYIFIELKSVNKDISDFLSYVEKRQDDIFKHIKAYNLYVRVCGEDVDIYNNIMSDINSIDKSINELKSGYSNFFNRKNKKWLYNIVETSDIIKTRINKKSSTY